ncbi:MAG: hypothetical protein ABIP39_06610 [Polyangiaceae bacterium]
MAFGKPSGAVQRAAQALAAADGVAHIAFFSMFAWRVISGSGFRIVQAGFAALAVLGLASGVVGWSLVRHGGKSKARTLGLYAICASTGLAAILLMVASWTGD